MKSFQTLFPPLAPQSLTLSSARRVVLISYNADRGTVDFRHYIITVKPYGVSKRVRRVLEGTTSTKKATTGFLDLGNERDVADFLLRRKGELGPSEDGYESAASSASSAAGDDGDAVSLADDYVGRNNKKGQRRAVRLDEVGPRMELRLVKITEGVPGKEGNVIYHEFVTKTKKEVAEMKAIHAAKEKLRKERREEQERNVRRKKAKTNDGDASGSDEDDGEEDGEDDGVGVWDDEEDISDGEGSDAESESEPEERPPGKKVRIRHD